MSEKTERVVVTGADGFIGSHLVEALVRKGDKVRALAQYNSFNSWGWLDTVPKNILDEVEVISGDIRDPFMVHELLKNQDRVYHLAALIAIPFSYLAPHEYIETNMSGTLNVLKGAMASDCAVIQTSTSEVYGTAQYVPIDELHPLNAQSPYAASKIGADQLALSFYRSFEQPVSVLRPFNTFGPRQSARAVIPTIISQLAAGYDEIKLGALSPTRDFTYVADTVSGFIHMARHQEKLYGEVVNLGTGHEVSIGDLAQILIDLFDSSAVITCEQERMRPEKSEVNRLLSNNDKAKELIHWTPEFGGRAGLRAGLDRTREWFTNPENLKRYKADIFNV